MEAEDKGLTDEIDNPAGLGLKPIHNHFESDVPAAVRSDDSPIKSQPDQKVRRKLVVPDEGRIEEIAEKNAQRNHYHHEDEKEDSPPFNERDESSEESLHSFKC